jgi:hypothetical protein
MSFKTIPLVVSCCIALVGCASIGIATAPKKVASTSRTEAAKKADELFWSTLHSGAYDRIPVALQAVTGAYLADPGDHLSAAHTGWLHIWRLSERQRLGSASATITDDATLSRKYFEEAVALNPKDARYLGFLASALLAEGDIHKDEAVTRTGYFMMLDAIKAWPEFNLFTAGYVMSSQPAESERFKQAVGWQWETLDRCVGEKVDRTAANYSKYMSLATTQGPKRVCWNSTIAPHNFEGFFLNMGDMLVKSGDWRTGQKIYANAKFSPTYGDWKFQQVLDARIRDAEGNVATFNSKTPTDDAKRMMNATTFSCMACHQN